MPEEHAARRRKGQGTKKKNEPEMERDIVKRMVNPAARSILRVLLCKTFHLSKDST